MKLTMPAWRNEEYLSLAEILLLIGRFFVASQWYVQVEEVAPEPGAELLEKIDPKMPVDIFTLLHLVTPKIQIIDGTVIAIDSGSSVPRLILRAVDSTSWDIESNIEGVGEIIRAEFPDALDFDN